MHPFHANSRGNGGPSVALVWFLLSTLCVCTGCPTGAYREQMQKRGQQIAQHTPGSDLLTGPLPLPETTLQIRVPKCFTQEAFLPDGPQKMQRKQLEIPIPGHLYTFESHADHDGVKLPYYCCLAVADKDPMSGIQKQLQLLFQGLDAKLEDRGAGNRTWKKIQVEIDQNWIPLDAGGKEMPSRTLPGVLEFDCVEAGGKWIIVGWRVPRAIEKAVKLDRAIGPMLASLEEKP